MFSPSDTMGRHPAKIHREHIFEDAYKAFNGLGSGLKDPIQITFVDAFGQQEAGIDGGGVTKEFLTSITTEAFKANTRPPMFVENAQNLLYPNPSSLEELKYNITERANLSLDSDKGREAVKNFLSRYEFLGRIIGKCMYEGILVNVNFAGFFLLKWALTGGAGHAPRESGYRANLNDLRELDEDLYNGLVRFMPIYLGFTNECVDSIEK
jgi:ubiquitin-protein ligase E3 C